MNCKCSLLQRFPHYTSQFKHGSTPDPPPLAGGRAGGLTRGPSLYRGSSRSVLAGYRNPTTIRSYRRALRGFFAWWERDGEAAPLTLTLLRANGEALRATVEPRTVNFYLAILRRFCCWLVDQGLLP